MANISNFIKSMRDIMRNDSGINGDAQRIEQISWMLFLKVYDTKEQYAHLVGQKGMEMYTLHALGSALATNSASFSATSVARAAFLGITK